MYKKLQLTLSSGESEKDLNIRVKKYGTYLRFIRVLGKIKQIIWKN